MITGRSLAAIAIAMALVAGLAGCAAPAPSRHHSAIPTPTPTPTEASTPTVQVPATCSGMFPTAAVSTVLDAPATVARDSSTPVASISDAAALQYGSLQCTWTGSSMTKGVYDQQLDVVVVPKGKAGYSSWSGYFSKDITNAVGDLSEYGCSVTEIVACQGDMMVDSYWVDAALTAPSKAGLSVATANERMKQVLTTVAATIKGKALAASWSPTLGSMPTFCENEGTAAQIKASTATVNAAFPGSDVQFQSAEFGGNPAALYAQSTSIFDVCGWGAEGANANGTLSGLSLQFLNGGSWALPRLIDRSDTSKSPFTSTTIPGAGRGGVNCDAVGDKCESVFAIGTVLVDVSTNYIAAPQLTAALAKLATGIRASQS